MSLKERPEVPASLWSLQRTSCFCPHMGAEVLRVQDRMGPGWAESEGAGLTTECSGG